MALVSGYFKGLLVGNSEGSNPSVVKFLRFRTYKLNDSAGDFVDVVKFVSSISKVKPQGLMANLRDTMQ